MTWAMRRRSAMTGGRSGSMSIRMLSLPPPLRNEFLARSTRAAASDGSGETDNLPLSMRAMSSRSVIRSLIWSACCSMIRKNRSISAGSSELADSFRVVADPLMEARGVRSSWLTTPRNSARCRSNSSSGVRSCRVTTTDSTSPSAEEMGVALTSVVTLLPSGTATTISSARTVSPAPSARASGNSSREISRPSARRKVRTSRSCSTSAPGVSRYSSILLVSWLIDTGAAVLASKTTTPMGVVSIRVSRSALARCSSRCLRALAITSAAWDANITRVSSSSWLNSWPESLWAR